MSSAMRSAVMFAVVGVSNLLYAAPQLLRPTPAPLPPRPTMRGMIAVGNLTGHGYPDVAYQMGNQVRIAAAPAILLADDAIASNATVYDLACHHRVGAHGLDGLLMATSAGVNRWEQPNLLSRLDSRVFARVTTGDLDGDGREDFLGFNLSGTQVMVRSFGATILPPSLLLSGETISSITAMDWNGDGIDEIAVGTDVRVFVFDSISQATQFSFPFANRGATFMARVKNGRRNFFAWCAKPSSAAPFMLHVAGASGLEQMQLPNMAVVGMTAADANGDAYTDLAFTTSDSPNILALVNQRFTSATATIFTLAVGAARRIVFGSPWTVGTVNVADAWVGDLDNDGTTDAVMPQVSAGKLGVYLNRLMPLVSRVSRPQPINLFCTDNGTSLDFRLTLLPVTTIDDATEVELLLYAVRFMSDESGLRPEMLPTGLGRFRASVVNGVSPANLTFSLPRPSNPLGELCVCGVLRFVLSDSQSGDVVTAYAPRFIGIATGNYVYHLDRFPGSPTLHMLQFGGGITSGYVDPPALPPKARVMSLPLPLF